MGNFPCIAKGLANLTKPVVYWVASSTLKVLLYNVLTLRKKQNACWTVLYGKYVPYLGHIFLTHLPNDSKGSQSKRRHPPY